MTDQVSIDNSFELDLERDDQVGRGAVVCGENSPINAEDLQSHADNYGNYRFQKIDEESFSVVHQDGFKGEFGEFETWEMAYGLSRIEEDRYFVWLRYRPKGETENRDASKPWKNIIEKLGGK